MCPASAIAKRAQHRAEQRRVVRREADRAARAPRARRAGRQGNDRAVLVSNARPCARLARLATGLLRNASDSWSSSRKPCGIAMSGRHQRQRAAPGLRPPPGAQTRAERRASRDLSVLHARLEPARMREPAGREPRIDQLPQQELMPPSHRVTEAQRLQVFQRHSVPLCSLS